MIAFLVDFSMLTFSKNAHVQDVDAASHPAVVVQVVASRNRPAFSDPHHSMRTNTKINGVHSSVATAVILFHKEQAPCFWVLYDMGKNVPVSDHRKGLQAKAAAVGFLLDEVLQLLI